MAEVRVDHLSKVFGPTYAVRDLSLVFPHGLVTCILGPSGCGKTTLLRMIAGLEQPSHGEILFDGQPVTHLSTRQRDLGMVFQSPVVYPESTVYRNVELPLLARGVGAGERKRRVSEMLSLLGLDQYADHSPADLNNAARQLVAVARALARKPRVLLFDEPLTNVDPNARLQLKAIFKRICRDVEQTFIYVTHDQTEAMTLADQIMLMRDGIVIHCGAPRDLYNNPADQFAAWFLGSPGMNVFSPTASAAAKDGGLTIESPFSPRIHVRGLSSGDIEGMHLGIRPEDITVSAEARSDALHGRVLRAPISVGGQRLLDISVGTAVIRVKVWRNQRLSVGDSVWVRLPVERIVLFLADGRKAEADLAYDDDGRSDGSFDGRDPDAMPRAGTA